MPPGVKAPKEQLESQEVIVQLGIDETSKWHDSFTLVSKVKSKVRLCPDPGRLNKVLTIPVHIGPVLKDILPRLPDMKYLKLIDMHSRYNNLCNIVENIKRLIVKNMNRLPYHFRFSFKMILSFN